MRRLRLEPPHPVVLGGASLQRRRPSIREPPGLTAAGAGLASGCRAAGLVLAGLYLAGAADGPVVIVVGGLGLTTFGRAVAARRVEPAFAAVALAVLAGALGIPGLRWQVLDLSVLRGVQGVLGPTVDVGPLPVALASGVAAGAALVALGLGAGTVAAPGRAAWAWTGLELVAGAWAAVTVFYGPAIPGWGMRGQPWARPELVAWVAAVGAASLIAALAAFTGRRLPPAARWGLLGACGLAVLVGAGVLVGTLYR